MKDQTDAQTLPLYKEILRKLEPPQGRFTRTREDHHRHIQEHLCRAYQELVRSGARNDAWPFNQNDLSAINQCLHLATSIVLLTSTDENIDEAKAFVQDRFSDQDPTTIITIAMLFELLRSHRDWLNEQQHSEKKQQTNTEDEQYQSCEEETAQWRKQEQICQSIERRFSQINWMIGRGDAIKLGIEKASESGTKID